MSDEQYATLADVYDWLVPDELPTPQGSVAAFAPVVAALPADARVLDCACFTIRTGPRPDRLRRRIAVNVHGLAL